ncbi:MAG TPA: putative lipid II flippase FtsW [Candidatus Limnocylindrales bacterium]|nr:putative lipid II flippase FtsW [Candidatus Limnocylindrales bacterium]
MMQKQTHNNYDRTLLLVTMLLLGIGLLMIFSAGFAIAKDVTEDPFYFLKRQALWIALGLAGMFCVSHFNYRIFKRLSFVILLLNFVLLALLFTGFGSTLGTEARRWLSFGGMILQPSEFSKLALVIFTAAYMSRRSHSIKNFWTSSIVPIVLVMITFVIIQAQPDLGTALVLLAGTAMVFIFAGMPLLQFTGVSLLFLPFLAYFLVTEEYRMQRIFSFRNPWAEPFGAGYHIIQSLFALGSGNIFGVGLGRSMQKQFYLPEPQNDFIFAVIGEELGFLGATAVILLYLIFIWRGFMIAMKAPDIFGSLLAAGITFMLAIQTVVNIAAVTGSLPITGINLPLISAGGSSVFFSLIGIGILLNISKYSQQYAA